MDAMMDTSSLANKLFDSILQYIPQYSLLICRSHQAVILPCYLRSHLTLGHKCNSRVYRHFIQIISERYGVIESLPFADGGPVWTMNDFHA